MQKQISERTKKHVGRPRETIIAPGAVFGRLTAIGEIDAVGRARIILCSCECGKETYATPCQLSTGRKKSCGCLRKERFIKNSTTHGLSKDRLYGIWSDMKRRCLNKNRKWFENYGGRGIGVCQEWIDSFEAFSVWAHKNGYQDNLTIDRKNNNGDYEPSNCRWATYQEQANNKSSNRVIEYNGEKRTLTQWSEKTGIRRETLGIRLNRWPKERAFTEPVHPCCHRKNK